MKKTRTGYLENLFERLETSWDLRKEVSAIGKFFREPIWVLVPLVKHEKISFTKNDFKKYFKEQAYHHKIGLSDIDKIYAGVNKSRKDKKITSFAYGDGYFGMSCPLKAEGRVFGFIVLCGISRKVEHKLQIVFQSFTDTLISETQKEIELEELNETIRPRAIALSTVHTLHRLVCSTLSMNELLPRIARLALQVIRANRCSIKIVDKKRKTLIPKTTVDLRITKAKLKKVEIGKYAPGRAVKQGRSVRGKNYLATPLIEDETLGVITLYDKIDGTSFTPYDEEIMKTLAEQAVITIKNAQLYQEQENLTMSSIQCIAMLLQTRPLGAHVAEAAFRKLISAIGRKFNMNESEIKMMQYASMLHDTGQMGIPEKVLIKKGKLTGNELDIIRTHPMKGADILSKFKPLKPIVPIILYHHENYDGTGYPRGLKKEEIPLAARIMAVISSFEAMITDKPYRKAISIPAAIKELKKNSGTQFDPKVVKAFEEAISRKGVMKLLRKELGHAS